MILLSWPRKLNSADGMIVVIRYARSSLASTQKIVGRAAQYRRSRRWLLRHAVDVQAKPIPKSTPVRRLRTADRHLRQVLVVPFK